MGLSRTVFEINGDFSQKSHAFSHPHWSSSWNWVSAFGDKN